MHNGPGMRAKTYQIVAALVMAAISFARADAQQVGINARGIIERAEVSGIADDELSPAIRDDVQKLVGQQFDQRVADELLMRIQSETPDFIASTRLLPGNQPDRLRVVFFLERTNADANVNSRYTVERVEIQGYDESKLDQSTRDDLKAMVGEKLDDAEADQIRQKIQDELGNRYYVIRRTVKGADRQHIVVVYELRKIRFIPFISPQQIVYHSKQNFSASLSAGIIDRRNARLFVGFANDQDHLIERYAGLNGGLEITKIGTDHLGLALRYSRYHQQWQPSTVLADRDAIYRGRTTFDPTITFAFDRRLRVTAGFSLADLQMQYPVIHHLNANVVVGSVHFGRRWGPSNQTSHLVEVDYDFRAGSPRLDSDFSYTRHFAQARYVYGEGGNRLTLAFRGGTIAGQAPLFERFSLGNTSTLRGWNKFDITPVGGNRVAHLTVEYGFGGKDFNIQLGPHRNRDSSTLFSLFYDSGVVGDHGSPMQLRHSIGFGIGDSSDFFAGIGFPLRSSHATPIFIAGFRF